MTVLPHNLNDALGHVLSAAGCLERGMESLPLVTVSLSGRPPRRMRGPVTVPRLHARATDPIPSFYHDTLFLFCFVFLHAIASIRT